MVCLPGAVTGLQFRCWICLKRGKVGGLQGHQIKVVLYFCHLLTIPMTLFKDIVPYFDEFIHVYG